SLVRSFLVRQRPPACTLLPYTTLFRSAGAGRLAHHVRATDPVLPGRRPPPRSPRLRAGGGDRRRVPGSKLRCRGSGRQPARWSRSEEHTSELQSRENLVCRLLLEKKKS